MTTDEMKAVRDLQRISQRLSNLLYSERVAANSFETADKELQKMGIDVRTLTEEQTNIIPLSSTVAESQTWSEQPSIAERLAEKIRWCRDLLFFEPQFAAGGNLAGAALLEADKPREIVLAKELTESELSRIPWAGPKVKLSKTVDAKKGTAIYHAFVTSVHPAAPTTGVLRVVLIAPDGRTAETRLKSNDRKKMIEGVELPADSSELHYTLFIE